MTFVKAASKKDLEPGILGVKLNGKDVLIVISNGKYYALGNACTHRGCKLSDGMVKEGSIKCPCHGSVFDVKTGKLINGPAKEPEPSFKVKVKGDQILVNI